MQNYNLQAYIFMIFSYPCYREIMREIKRLRVEQDKHAKASSGLAQQQRNPTLLSELKLLRQRRDELEARMSALQDSRRELMMQLESLMKLLKVSLKCLCSVIKTGTTL